MIPSITSEQRDALAARRGRVVYFVDVVTHEEFAVLPAETYRQVAPLLDPNESFDPRDLYPLIDEAWKPLYEETALDVYEQDYLAPPQR